MSRVTSFPGGDVVLRSAGPAAACSVALVLILASEEAVTCVTSVAFYPGVSGE